MPVCGRCVCCGQQLSWLQLLEGMQPFGAGTAEAKARAKGGTRSRWALQHGGIGEGTQARVMLAWWSAQSLRAREALRMCSHAA
jgi:hypothetical protein